ncbi:hypothetical protein FOA52_001965 [Chlamydomonas sp. UWO 241]|nr:hypothetical protein FOA52_001965 [Chlamydomonas sp. UWO 241]
MEQSAPPPRLAVVVGQRLVVTATGFTPAEREELCRMAEALGGCYLPELVHRATAPRDYTTHLVCKSMMCAFGTPKFTRALEWGLPVVTWRWLRDSLQTQALQPVERYKTDSLDGAGHLMVRPAQLQQPLAWQPTVRLPAQQQHRRVALAEVSNQVQAQQQQLVQQQKPRQQPSAPAAKPAPAPAPALPPAARTPEFSFFNSSARHQPAGRHRSATPDVEAALLTGPPAPVPAAAAPPLPPAAAPTFPLAAYAAPAAATLQPGALGVNVSPLPAGFEVSSPSFGSMGTGAGRHAFGGGQHHQLPRGGGFAFPMDADADDLIIPGTQAPDDDFDDGHGSPQSLLTYLQNKMTLGGAGGGGACSRGGGGAAAATPAHVCAGDGEAESAADDMLVSPVPRTSQQLQQQLDWGGDGDDVDGMDVSPAVAAGSPRHSEQQQQQDAAAPERPSMLYSGFSGDLCDAAASRRAREVAATGAGEEPATAPQRVAAAATPETPRGGDDHPRIPATLDLTPAGLDAAADVSRAPAAAVGVVERRGAPAPSPPRGALSTNPEPRMARGRGGGAAVVAVKPEPCDDDEGVGSPGRGEAGAVLGPMWDVGSEGASDMAVDDADSDGGEAGGEEEGGGEEGEEAWEDALEDEEEEDDDGGAPSFDLGVAQPQQQVQSQEQQQGQQQTGRLQRLQRGASQADEGGGSEDGDNALDDTGLEDKEMLEDEEALEDTGLEDKEMRQHDEALEDEEVREPSPSRQDGDRQRATAAPSHVSFSTTSSSAAAAALDGVSSAERGGGDERRVSAASGEEGRGSCAPLPRPAHLGLVRVKTEPGTEQEHADEADAAFAAPPQPPHTMQPPPSGAQPAQGKEPGQGTQPRQGTQPATQAPEATQATPHEARPPPPFAALSGAAKALASARAARRPGATGGAAAAGGPATQGGGGPSSSQQQQRPVAVKPDPDGRQPGTATAAVGGAHRRPVSASASSGPVAALAQLLSRHVASAPGLVMAHGSKAPSVEVLKALARAPRGCSAKQQHGLSSTKGLEFAEQVTVYPPGVTISTKDRSKAGRCPLVLVHGFGGGEGEWSAVAGDPHALYLNAGEWWLEYSPLVSAADAAEGARAAGKRPVLPPDLAPSCELLRCVARAHARLADVVGDVEVVRTKKLPARLAPNALYVRHAWDDAQHAVVTDAPVSEFTLER